MPSMVSRGRGRRTINEINMVPFIDVMLVLLIIFMVTAPLITTGVVDLPSIGTSNKPPDRVIELVVSPDEVRLKLDKKDAGLVPMDQIAARVAATQAGDENTVVVISADKSVKYDLVVQVMSKLREAKVKRIGLSVKSGG